MYVSPAAMCVELGNPGGLRCELGLKVARVGVVLEDWHMRRLQRARRSVAQSRAADRRRGETGPRRQCSLHKNGDEGRRNWQSLRVLRKIR